MGNCRRRPGPGRSVADPVQWFLEAARQVLTHPSAVCPVLAPARVQALLRCRLWRRIRVVSPAEEWREMRKLTTVIGLVLILALGLVTTAGRPEPARAATGDNL